MITLTEHIMQPLERLNRVYFSDPSRTLEFGQGEKIVGQGEECRRIYLILEGSVIAYHCSDTIEGSNLPEETAKRGYEVFRASAGSYICVQAFFSRYYHSSNYIIALEDTKVAYIDDTTEAVDVERYGGFDHQFIPVLVHELAERNSRIFSRAAEKEEAMRLLQRAEMAAGLSQLAAGIAHELNNAVGVISRRTEFVAQNLSKHLEEEDGENARLFRFGYDDESFVPAGELRKLSRKYERELNMPQEAAKVLAHIVPDTETLVKYGPEFVGHVRRNYGFWELGHDLRDMQTAARHATGIVRSVKLLGGGNSTRQPDADVTQSLHDAMNLLGNRLKHCGVITEIGPLPLINADPTELVQLWTNIIKNACDAMEQDHTPDPTIRIKADVYHADGVSLLPEEYVRVAISNNGPVIPEEIRDKIFHPNFTTKKLGLDFGLGLGLSIVRRIVDAYNGTIALHSESGGTSFIINLPTSQIHGNN